MPAIPRLLTVVTALAVTVSPACSTTTVGTARPAATLGTSPAPTTTTAPPPPAPLDNAALEAMLLRPDAIANLTGVSDITPITSWTGARDTSAFIDDPACASIPGAGEGVLYSNTGYVALRGDHTQTPPGTYWKDSVDVSQAVASYLTPRDATGLIQRARDTWQRCSNRPFAFEFLEGDRGTIDFGAMVDLGGRLSIPIDRDDNPTWKCTHVIAVQRAVVAEARVCLHDKDTNAAANTAVDQLLAAAPS